jgi:hypothetical protein
MLSLGKGAAISLSNQLGRARKENVRFSQLFQ